MNKRTLCCILAVCSVCVLSSESLAQSVYFDDSDSDTIKVGNNHYEVSFLKSTGSISVILDKSSDQVVSSGTSNGHLWGAVLVDDEEWEVYTDSPSDTVSYEWNSAENTLVFNYSPNSAGSQKVPAQVYIEFSEDPYFDLQISLDNFSGNRLQSVDLPYGLQMNADDIEEAIIPLMPGVKFKKKYFEERRSGAIGAYPEVLVFADYIFFSLNSGHLGIYTVLEEDITPNVERALEAPATGFDNYKYRHAYVIGLLDGASWRSPFVRFRIGQDELQTAAGYRKDTGLANFTSIQEKLGNNYKPVSQSILNQIGAADNFRASGLKLSDRDAYNRIWNLLPSPSILFFVGWEKGLGGSDAAAPDIFPIDSRLGTDEDMRIVLEDARRAGHLIMPYINPTIWNINSPTVQSLAPEDFAALDANGNPIQEYYGNPLGVQYQYATSPYAPAVISRLQRVFVELQEKMPIDLVYEDQIGPRGGLDYNPVAPSPAHYPQGWLEHTRRYQDFGLMTDFGYDRLIETIVNFLGNLILWDHTVLPNSTWDGYGNEMWGSDTWEYYPIVPIMAGDKVVFNSMAADSPTSSKPILTWNMAMKQMLGFFGVSGSPFNRVWRNTAAAFQKHVISRYFHERMLDYTHVGEDATKSRFATHEVLTNWSKTSTLAAQNYILATEGFLVTSYTQDLIAGIFTNYNGQNLSAGDHYIIETRFADSLVVRHPQGEDTAIRLDWQSLGADANLRCYAFADSIVFQVPVEIDSQYISFDLKMFYEDIEVDRYVITAEPLFLTAPMLTEPADWATVQAGMATLKWENVETASSYQIQVATEDTFDLSLIDSAKTTQTEFTSDKLVKGLTYFWRVRAMNALNTGQWSLVNRFRTAGININDRLVAYYPLDGSPEDSTGNNDGTLIGQVTLAPDRFDNPDQAYSFDGDEDYIAFSESKPFTTIDKQLTISTWVYPISLKNETGVMVRDFYWYLLINADGLALGYVFDETQDARSATSGQKRIPLNKWSFLAYTHNGQTINLYIDGKQVGSAQFFSQRIGNPNESAVPTLGRGVGDFWNDFHGSIDEVRLYDRALSREEMAELYRKTATENFPPQIVTFSPAIDTVITEGDSLEFSIAVQDEDNDTLFCTWYYDETSIAIDTTTNDTSTILIHFPLGSVGTHSVKASVSDGELLADTTWSITVEELATGIQLDDNIPTEYLLNQNYPNPFNPSTTISYQLPQPGNVKISVFNVAGQLVETLVDEHKKAGYHSVIWRASGVGSGLYFYKIKAGDYISVKKCIVMK